MNIPSVPGASRLLAPDLSRTVLRETGGSQSIAYAPFGYAHWLDRLSTRLAFNGELAVLPHGHYLLGHGYRGYRPALARFGQPDDLSPFGRGGLNAYAYCNGDPVNHVDPDGHAPAGLAGIKGAITKLPVGSQDWLKRRAQFQKNFTTRRSAAIQRLKKETSMHATLEAERKLDKIVRVTSATTPDVDINALRSRHKAMIKQFGAESPFSRNYPQPRAVAVRDYNGETRLFSGQFTLTEELMRKQVGATSKKHLGQELQNWEYATLRRRQYESFNHRRTDLDKLPYLTAEDVRQGVWNIRQPEV